ncbi:MAG TPA: hypothetical protein DIW61_13445 [Candidatus Aminicenantes bacterium]|nr:hypothetical protein [Candidatus Aminicenantes bacterium]
MRNPGGQNSYSALDPKKYTDSFSILPRLKRLVLYFILGCVLALIFVDGYLVLQNKRIETQLARTRQYIDNIVGR